MATKLKKEKTQIAWWVSDDSNGWTRRQRKRLKKGIVLEKSVNGVLKACRNGFHSCQKVTDTSNYSSGGYLWMVRIPSNTSPKKGAHRSYHMEDKSVSTYRHHVDMVKIDKWDRKVIKPAVEIIEVALKHLEKKRKYIAPIIFETLEKAKKRGNLTRTEEKTIHLHYKGNIHISTTEMIFGKIKETRLNYREALEAARDKLLARNT